MIRNARLKGEFQEAPQQDRKRSLHISALQIGSAVAILVSISGCSEKQSLPPIPPKPRIESGTANAEQRCPCENSAGVYAFNPRDVPVQVQYTIYEKDTSSSVVIQPKPNNNVTVPAKSGGVDGKAFIGCNQYAPATSCRFRAVYQLDSYSTTLAMAQFRKFLGPTDLGETLNSLAVCKAICSAPPGGAGGTCLQLGVRYFKSVAPVATIADHADQDGTVSHASFMASYGLRPADDQCNRGAIQTKSGIVTNVGPNGKCVVRNEDLTSRVARKLGLAAQTDTLGMMTGLPKTLEAQKDVAHKLAGSERTVTFERTTRAPVIAFDGAGGPQLTRRYGGPVLGVGKISGAGRPNQTIVSTASGCIAIDEP